MKEYLNKNINYLEGLNTENNLSEHGQIELSLLKDIKKQFDLHVVGGSFSIGFAQYIAKEHYTCINQIGKIYYWRNEEFSKTTEQLLRDYKETLS